MQADLQSLTPASFAVRKLEMNEMKVLVADGQNVSGRFEEVCGRFEEVCGRFEGDGRIDKTGGGFDRCVKTVRMLHSTVYVT